MIGVARNSIVGSKMNVMKRVLAVALCIALALGAVFIPVQQAHAARIDTVVNTYRRVMESRSMKYLYTQVLTYKDITYKNGYYLKESIWLSGIILGNGNVGDNYRNVWKSY